MSEISREELVEMQDRGEEFVLLDVLPPAYFRHSHLPDAINLPLADIELHIAEVVPDKTTFVVAYCLNSSCRAAEKAVQILTALGYQNVREYSGGKGDWQAAGLVLHGESRRLIMDGLL